MFVIRCFNRGDKSELYKVHRVKSLSFNFTENICQGYSWSRGWKNLVGIDVHVHASEALYEKLREPRIAPPPRLVSMLNAGLLGRKSGRGFYRYDD